MEDLSFLVDTQLKVEKLRVATQVRNSHLRKRKKVDPTTLKLQEEIQNLENFVDGVVADKIKDHPAYDWFSRVKGVGRENIAKVVGPIRVKPDPDDPEKDYADTISALWRFAGFDVGKDGKAPKSQKGEKHHYNATLRAMCWRLATSLVRLKKPGKYCEYYLKEKEKYRQKYLNEGYKIVPSEKLPTKNKKKYEPEGVISEGHLDNQAKRKMIKLFLAHLWLVWRQVERLPITKPYVIEKLGHNYFIDPYEFCDR